MISLDTKTESLSSSSITLPTSDEEPKLSFSELLKGVGAKKDDKIIQNGSLILAIQDPKQTKIALDTKKFQILKT